MELGKSQTPLLTHQTKMARGFFSQKVINAGSANIRNFPGFEEIVTQWVLLLIHLC